MRNRRGQNIAEYSILIALVIGAAVAMQTYVKRGLQGRIHEAVDHAPAVSLGQGEQMKFDTGQYEPYYVDSHMTQGTDKSSTDKIETEGKVTRSNINETSKVEKGGWDTVKSVDTQD